MSRNRWTPPPGVFALPSTGGGSTGNNYNQGSGRGSGLGVPMIHPVMNPAVPPPATPDPPATAADEPAATATDDSALDVMRKWFAKIGIVMDAEMETLIVGWATSGYTGADLESGLLIPDLEKTSAFKTRFPGYEAYKANHQGSAPSLRTYIDLEVAYTDILRDGGMPVGFYDDYSDFARWIADGVAPEEIQARVNLALDAAKGVDPTMRNLMARFYGLSTGDVASYFLDPDRARNVIEHQYESAGVASWAARSGYEITDMSRYEQLVTDGITAGQAAQSYGTVKSLQDAVGKAAGVYGETYNQDDAEGDVFYNRNDKRRKVMSLEQANFGGSSAGATGTSKRQSY